MIYKVLLFLLHSLLATRLFQAYRRFELPKTIHTVEMKSDAFVYVHNCRKLQLLGVEKGLTSRKHPAQIHVPSVTNNVLRYKYQKCDKYQTARHTEDVGTTFKG